MDDNIISSSPREKDRGEWPTPVRATIRSLQRDGLTQREIKAKTSVPRTTLRRILKQESSRRSCKGKVYKPHLMSTCEIHRVIQELSKNYNT
jgi:DNA invertase Pin-like site-specific DNA recombinase